MKKLSLAFALLALASMGSSPVLAAGTAAGDTAVPSCDCQTPNGPSFVSKVSGSVDMSAAGSSGLVPVIVAGTPILPGTQLVTGADGSAMIQVGSQCKLDIASNSEVLVSAVGGDLCVQLGDTGGGGTIPSSASIPPAPAVSGPVLLGVVAAGAGIAYAIGELGDEGDGPASN